MKNSDLAQALNHLGFPLFETVEKTDVNLVLADLVMSRNLRLWEGFPVVLANTARDGLFNFKKVNQHLKKSSDQLSLASLMALSLALYKVLNLKFLWAVSLYQSLNEKNKKQFEGLLKSLKDNQDVQLGRCLMSSQRLKTTFNNYFRQERDHLKDLLSVKEDLSLGYALSEVFSPKQKELFLKKLKSEKLNKTEKEYFSRVVRKKVLALANSELHRLSQKLLE